MSTQGIDDPFRVVVFHVDLIRWRSAPATMPSFFVSYAVTVVTGRETQKAPARMTPNPIHSPTADSQSFAVG